jgi:predicted outer membrane repeat protein
VIHGASRFHDCTFDNNQSALNGGAVESTVCDVQFINTTFTNNRAAGAGGAVYFEVQDIKKKCKPDQFFYNTTFLGNVAADYGNDSATNPAEGILPYKNAPPATIRPGERFSIRVASNDLFKQRCKGEHINFQGSVCLAQLP